MILVLMISTFDILIDKSTIKSIDANSLKNTIQDYGSIIIKIIDGVIDKDRHSRFYPIIAKV